MMMKIEHSEKYDRFMDAVRLSLLVWRDRGGRDFSQLCDKLDMSERTVRRRFQHPETLTLAELYAWCELYGKDPCELLLQAFEASKCED